MAKSNKSKEEKVEKNPVNIMDTFILAGQLEEAFNKLGGSMMSNDFAAKLLAWLYMFGGGNEAVTLHQGLNSGIAIAQEKFKIKGGCVPDTEGVILINKYIKELEVSLDDTVWIKEIFDRYGLVDGRELKEKKKK